jgi:3-methyladenine DNA glycosylase AlkD
VSVPDLRKVARTYRDLARQDVGRLLRSPWHEERFLALLILVDQYETATPRTRDEIFRFYLRHTRWINNWDLVDVSAARIVGAHLESGSRRHLRRLARSTLVWERRIAMIATHHYIRKGDFRDALAMAALLIDDQHDLSHKAVGWMLREVGNRDRRTAERFLRRHARTMPRTALRYAIERFPARLRRTYLRTS